MATSTYGTYLMQKGTGETWEKLVDIKDFPDLQGEPNLQETTTLSDPAVTQIFGIKQATSKGFKANYVKETYETILALEGELLDIGVWFGHTEAGVPDGHDGKFVGKGYLSVVVNGAGVNAVKEMTVSFAMTEEFALEA